MEKPRYSIDTLQKRITVSPGCELTLDCSDGTTEVYTVADIDPKNGQRETDQAVLGYVKAVFLSERNGITYPITTWLNGRVRTVDFQGEPYTLVHEAAKSAPEGQVLVESASLRPSKLQNVTTWVTQLLR